MLPLIISYYTENSVYEKEVEGLIKSCSELKLETDIEKIRSLGSWEKNCAFKAEFILKKLKEHKRSVLWLDSDAVVLQKPKFYIDAIFDFSLFINEGFSNDNPSKIFTSAVFVNYTEKAVNLIESWIEKTKVLEDKVNDLALPDQEILRDILLPMIGSKIDFVNMPASYTYIFDDLSNPTKPEDIFIMHFQASRLRFVVDKSLLEFLPFYNCVDQLSLKMMRQKSIGKDLIKKIPGDFANLREKYIHILNLYKKTFS